MFVKYPQAASSRGPGPGRVFLSQAQQGLGVPGAAAKQRGTAPARLADLLESLAAALGRAALHGQLAGQQTCLESCRGPPGRREAVRRRGHLAHADVLAVIVGQPGRQQDVPGQRRPVRALLTGELGDRVPCLLDGIAVLSPPSAAARARMSLASGRAICWPSRSI